MPGPGVLDQLSLEQQFVPDVVSDGSFANVHVPTYAYGLERSHRVQHAVALALRELVPRLEDRDVLTWRNLPLAFLYLPPFLFMAYLVRRKETHLMRLLLLPTVLTTTVWCTFRYKHEDPRMGWYEWDRGALFVCACGRV